MARLPMYEQQTIAQSPRATPQAFGAGTAEAQGGFGATLADIGASIQRRDSVIDRVRITTNLDTEMLKMLESARTEGDITSQETLSTMHERMRTMGEEAIKSHRGNSESRAELRNQVENQIGQYYKSALGEQIKAQKTLIAENVDTTIRTQSIAVAQAPQLIDHSIVELDRHIDSLSSSMSPQEAKLMREHGRSTMVQSAIQGLYNQGKHDEALEMLNSESYGPFLDPNVARTMTIKVVSEQARVQTEARKQDQRVQSFSAVLGTLTPEMEMLVRTLPTDPKDMTTADKFMEYSLIYSKTHGGRPMPPGVVERFYNVEKQVSGQAKVDTAADLAAQIMNFPNLSPQDQLATQLRAAKYLPDITTRDEQGNLFTTRGFSTVPGVGQYMGVSDAAEGALPTAAPGGIPPPRQGGSGFVPGRVQPSAPAGMPADTRQQPTPMGGQPTIQSEMSVIPQQDDLGQPPVGSEGGEIVSAGNARQLVGDVSDLPPELQQTIESGRSQFDMSLAQQILQFQAFGPRAVVSSGVRRLGMGGEEHGARSRAVADLKMSNERLIKSLQENKKYPEGEALRISKELGEMIRIIDSAEGASDRLWGIHKSLNRTLNRDIQMSSDRSLSVDERNARRAGAAVIADFIDNLGVRIIRNPVEMVNMADQGQLAEGDYFWTADGKVRQFTSEVYRRAAGVQ